ncbi:hypothetical protein BCR36DRAFT_370837 [Piromyces finnis]|uniref:Uncharacterized protein n=1 Tax=Piromyces finnis TaxID=1754191 RepID=A0A1Y1V8M2_9FUNG|nr:hypothetical protein BCR36DRAFT_370837 [Piromyces finnis]|eukprot:ORX49264.1 hypothetical protein BCR36DRAFT_370837 [Piromyces finnis]
MFKVSLHKFLFIVLLFTLVFQYVSATEEEQEVDNYIEGDETEMDKYNGNEEDRIRNLKFPHVDEVNEREYKKYEIPKIIHQYGNFIYIYIHKFYESNQLF